MKKKYIVICVTDSGDVCSADIFNTEQAASDFLAKDAADVYEEISENSESSISVYPAHATVKSVDTSYKWSIHPSIIQ